MLDFKTLIKNIIEIKKQLLIKGYDLDDNYLINADKKRKELQQQTESLQQQRNSLSKEVGILKSKQENCDDMLAKLGAISSKLKEIEAAFNATQNELNSFLLTIPNIPHESVPNGKNEDDNIVIRKFSDIPKHSFELQDHVVLGESLSLFDFKRAAKMSGSRFVVMYSELAQLQRALIKFMLDIHTTEHKYTEVYTPLLVNEDSLYGTGALPKMGEDLFQISGEKDLFLIPTAEVPLTNLHRDEIIDFSQLPLKYVAHTPCFRSEAGSYGKDTKGIIRQHQFEKVELFQICTPEKSYEALDNLLNNAEEILKRLNLPYQVVQLCGGDLSFSSAKTYDIEVWLPSQNCYREISSCSNFCDFQARRTKIRYKNNSKPELAHTINGSGLAIGRTLVAIMENYQNSDGSIAIPEALIPYMNGIKKIESNISSTNHI